MGLVEEFIQILKRPTIRAIIVEMIVFMAPVWIAFFVGIVVGWIWKPKWVSLLNCKFDSSASSSSDLIISSVKEKGIGSIEIKEEVNEELITLPQKPNCSSSEYKEEDCRVVSVIKEDFEHLCHLVERKDGGPPWKHMLDRSTPDMSYQCWQRDSETGPPQYCSRTVYENATPEMLRDFFWDDEFRLKWDDMITHAVTLEECPTTGTMVVHWIRKFPFFCSDREYIIGRRIWESGRTYYCVTKGVPCSSVPRLQKPLRVDLYYSSWSIQAVESRKGDGQLTACEVVLFHHEDMGIPWEIAKFGVRQGMWGAVKKIERGFRAYQKERGSSAPLSRPAFMARINTKIDPDYLKSLENNDKDSLDNSDVKVVPAGKPAGGSMNVPKALLFGGAVVLACSLDRGLLTKAVLFGVARRFANIGRRVGPRT